MFILVELFFIISVQDFRNQLYDLYYFNFVSPIPREQLESLAKASVENSVTQQIKKVKIGIKKFQSKFTV